MDLSQHERTIIRKAHTAQRWRALCVLMLAVTSVAFLGYATWCAISLIRHLANHDIPLSAVFIVLQESRHPSSINLSLIMSLVTLFALFTMVGLQTALGVWILIARHREQRLLLKLAQACYDLV